RDTLFEDLLEPAARREVGSWLRFSNRAAAERRDGFSPSALGFPGPLLRAFFRLAPVFELPGLRHAIRRLYFRTMRGTATIAWFTGPFEQHEDWVAAGRMLGRAWLLLTKHGVVLHPFGSIITNSRANAALPERVGAVARGPAHRHFLRGRGDPRPRAGCFRPDFSTVPITDKDPYVRRYSVEQRCVGGRIPRAGVVIDESSGTSGTPNNWVRGPVERREVKQALQVAFHHQRGRDAIFFLNAFAPGR